jgi:hypothetical protein
MPATIPKLLDRSREEAECGSLRPGARASDCQQTKLESGVKEALPGTRERVLYDEFEAAKRMAEASSVFARVEVEDGGRFPLTGRGDVNTYALFAELFASLTSKRGRAGVIVPTGIATDATTATFFAALLKDKRLFGLHDFQTGLGFFDRIGHGASQSVCRASPHSVPVRSLDRGRRRTPAPEA